MKPSYCSHFLLLCFILCFTEIYAQPITNNVSSTDISVNRQQDGRKYHSINDKALNGFYLITMSNAEKDYSKQHFKNGYLHGTSEVFINNKLKKYIDYCNGVFCGIYKKYHNNGKLALETQYNESAKRNGEYKQYQESDGRLIMKRHYKEGLIHGEQSRYFRNGEEAVEVITTYHNGMKNGQQKHFKRHNNYPSISNYKNDLLHGDSITYHNNGKVMTRVSYVDGVKTGLTEYYDEQGKLIDKY